VAVAARAGNFTGSSEDLNFFRRGEACRRDEALTKAWEVLGADDDEGNAPPPFGSWL
jgi:hypothetical protein